MAQPPNTPKWSNDDQKRLDALDGEDGPAALGNILADHLPTASSNLFYTLPLKLLANVEARVPSLARQPGWDTEYLLAAAASHFGDCIGFHHGRPLTHALLRYQATPPRGRLSQLTAALLGRLHWKQNPVQIAQAVETADQWLSWPKRVLRGYCGWLSRPSLFTQEWDRFRTSWANGIGQYGLPSATERAISRLQPQSLNAAAMPFLAALDDFLARWELRSLVGDGMPDPLMPQFRIPFSRMLSDPAMCNGTFFYFPQTMALPSEAILRRMLEDQILGNMPTHLTDWARIIRNSQATTGSQINTLGRQFEVGHDWRVLHDRWPASLHREKTVVIDAIADYQAITAGTIRRDLSALGL